MEIEIEIGDKVKFEDEEQEGVGTVVAINIEELFLVHSKDITDGHDSLGDKYTQDNNDNWWFSRDELELIEEDEE